MKRSLLILCVALVAGSLADPAHANATWMIGFKGGPSIATFAGDDIDADWKGSRVAFAGGIFVQADLSTHFGLRMEGVYHMKGATADSASVSARVDVDYIEFPVLLVGKLPAGENAVVSAFAGPVIGFNTVAELGASAGILSVTRDIKDSTASFEFSLALGAGVMFDVGSLWFTVDGRYQLGLTNVFEGTNQETGDTSDVKNRGWAFTAGLAFPIGGPGASSARSSR